MIWLNLYNIAFVRVMVLTFGVFTKTELLWPNEAVLETSDSFNDYDNVAPIWDLIRRNYAFSRGPQTCF